MRSSFLRINMGPSHGIIPLQPKTNLSQHQLSPTTTRTPKRSQVSGDNQDTFAVLPTWASANGHKTAAPAIPSPIQRREIWKVLNKPPPPQRSPLLRGYFAPPGSSGVIKEPYYWASEQEEEVIKKPQPKGRSVVEASAKPRRRELSAEDIDSGFASCSRCRKHKQISEFPPKMVSCGVCHGRLYPAREAPSGWA